MSDKPFNDTWQRQHRRLVRSTFKKAFIVAVHSASATADVYFAENSQTVINNIPLSSQITPSLVRVGDRCRVDVFDETNPNDMVIAYIYGRTFNPQKTLFNTGTGLWASGTALSRTVPHGLVDETGAAVQPDIWNVQPTSLTFYSPTGQTYTAYITSADDTNLYFERQPDNVISFNYLWFVVKFRT